VSLEERTRQPKDVGIEFAQALSGGDFKIASELAVGEAADFVKKDKGECGACSARVQARDKLMSVGTVLRANSVDSIVKVRTVGSGGETVRFLGVEREARKWRVNRVLKTAEEGTLKEAPAREDAPPSLRRPPEGPKSEAPVASGPAPGTPAASPPTPKPAP
jgi:hypothetical protein